MIQGCSRAYRYSIVFESAPKGLGHRFLVLFANDARRRRKHSECYLALCRIGGDTQLKEDAEKLWPLVICLCVSVVQIHHGKVRGRADRTAVTILASNLGDGVTDFITHGAIRFRTQGFEKLLPDNGGLILAQRDEHVHVLGCGSLPRFRGNAPKDDCSVRACLNKREAISERKRASAWLPQMLHLKTYCSFSRNCYLLGQPHEQKFWTAVGPVVLQVLLCLGANIIVGRLEGLEQLRQLRGHLGRKYRHVELENASFEIRVKRKQDSATQVGCLSV